MACRANFRVELRTAARIGSAGGLLDLQRAGSDEPCAIGNGRGEPTHIGDESLHLATRKWKHAAVHASLHAAVDSFFEQVHSALSRAVLRKLAPNASHGHCVRLGAS